MKKEKRIFITYLIPGSFFPEEVSEQVVSTSIPKNIPKDVFAFRFHETEFVIDGKKEFVGDTKKLSKTYVIGEAVPLDKIPLTIDGSDASILRSNIACNSPTKTGIRTHLGNWQFEDNDHEAISPSRFRFVKPIYYKER